MNPTDPTSQPLELQPWLWVAMAIVVFIGVSDRMRDHGERGSLEPSFAVKQVIVRSSRPDHKFPILNLQVRLPDGWSYLSVTDDAIADKPTFVNETEGSIVRLEPFRSQSWSSGQAVDIRQYEKVTIEWIAEHSRWKGRLAHPEADVILVVQKQSYKSGLNKAVEEFCDSIELIRTAD